MDTLTRAVEAALAHGSPSLATIQMILERGAVQPLDAALPVIAREELLALDVATPRLAAWDELVGVTR